MTQTSITKYNLNYLGKLAIFMTRFLLKLVYVISVVGIRMFLHKTVQYYILSLYKLCAMIKHLCTYNLPRRYRDEKLHIFSMTKAG